MSVKEKTAHLREASRQMVRYLGFLREGFSEADLSYTQCHILVELDMRGILTLNQLAILLCQDKSITCRAVSSLLDQKLVKRAPHVGDKRQKPITLTPMGKQKLATVNKLCNDQVSSALHLLSEEEQDQTIEGIRLYAKALKRSSRLKDLIIRPIQAKDNQALCHVIKQVMTEYGAVGCGFSIEDPEVEQMSQAYRKKGHAYFVAIKENAILGGSGIGPLKGCKDKGVCELRKMYLKPQARGLSLGRLLMEQCLEAAKKRGYKKIYLETLNNMVQARMLYDKYGFKPLKTPMGQTGHGGCNRWAIRDL